MVNTVPSQTTFPPVLPEPQNDPTNATNLTSGTVNPGRLPLPTATTLGAVVAANAPANQFVTGIGTFGTPLFAQPTFANIGGTIAGAQIPAPTPTAFGGTFSAAAPANQFQTGIDTTGTPNFAQPSFVNIAGTLLAAQSPAYTGAITSPAGSLSTTLASAAVGATNLVSGAAATSIGTLGGDLAGTLPNPAIAPNAVTNAKAAPMATLTVKSNITGATASGADNPLTAIIDAAIASTRGAILERGASGWTILAPGAAGTVVTSNGVGSDPSYLSPGALAVVPRSSVRQTVQGGPASGGAPAFLPTTSASLSLTAQNVATGLNALTIAAAAGFNATGPADIVTQLTANPTWSGLAGNVTNYLWINASTGATGVATLAPIYQFGGTIPTTSGQFTFDYQQMIGFLANGSSTVATPLVFVGEAVANATTVTGTIAYAYNGFFDSGYYSTLQAPSTQISRSHNLGCADALGYFSAKNMGPENGYTLGQIWQTPIANGSVMSIPAAIAVNRLTMITMSGNSGTGWYGTNIATGAQAAFTAANWSPRYVVRRGWGGA